MPKARPARRRAALPDRHALFDRHILYERAVQDAGTELALVERLLRRTGRPPRRLREDFRIAYLVGRKRRRSCAEAQGGAAACPPQARPGGAVPAWSWRGAHRDHAAACARRWTRRGAVQSSGARSRPGTRAKWSTFRVSSGNPLAMHTAAMR